MLPSVYQPAPRQKTLKKSRIKQRIKYGLFSDYPTLIADVDSTELLTGDRQYLLPKIVDPQMGTGDNTLPKPGGLYVNMIRNSQRFYLGQDW